MQIIKKQSSVQKEPSGLLAGMRVIAGFTLAPGIGPIVYYLLLSLTGTVYFSLPADPSFLIWATLMAGSAIYIPLAFIGVAVMMFIKRYYSWNLFSCTAGALSSAFLAMILFIIFQSLTGSEYIIASSGVTKLLTMVALPSLFWGIAFWLIAVYKNNNLDHFLQKSIENNEKMMMSSLQEVA